MITRSFGGEEKENANSHQSTFASRDFTIQHAAIQNPTDDNVIADRTWENVINYASSISSEIDRACFVSTNVTHCFGENSS